TKYSKGPIIDVCGSRLIPPRLSPHPADADDTLYFTRTNLALGGSGCNDQTNEYTIETVPPGSANSSTLSLSTSSAFDGLEIDSFLLHFHDTSAIFYRFLDAEDGVTKQPVAATNVVESAFPAMANVLGSFSTAAQPDSDGTT